MSQHGPIISYPSPKFSSTLARWSREYTVVRLFIHAIRREIYEFCPGIIAYLGSSADDSIDMFLNNIASSDHVIDWTLYFEFGLHLDIDTNELWEEICRAAVRRWLRTECLGDRWLAVRAKLRPQNVYVGMHAQSLGKPPKIASATLQDDIPFYSPFLYQTGVAAFSIPSGQWVNYPCHK